VLCRDIRNVKCFQKQMFISGRPYVKDSTVYRNPYERHGSREIHDALRTQDTDLPVIHILYFFFIPTDLICTHLVIPKLSGNFNQELAVCIRCGSGSDPFMYWKTPMAYILTCTQGRVNMIMRHIVQFTSVLKSWRRNESHNLYLLEPEPEPH
jgi:hypothetical protein